MGIGIKDYMDREEVDPTLPPEYSLPCASDTQAEREQRQAVKRLRRVTDQEGGE